MSRSKRYVDDAFRTELAVAGLLTDTASVTLSGHLELMHFSTAEEAFWEPRLALASSNGRRITVAKDYAFNWHFLRDYAGREAATAMAPAVQTLVREAVRLPDFLALLEAGETQSKPAPAAASVPTVTAPSARSEPLPVEFRHASGSHRTRPTFDERRYLREARRIQQTAKWLVLELGEDRPTIPAYAVGSDVEQIGQSTRRRLLPLLTTPVSS